MYGSGLGQKSSGPGLEVTHIELDVRAWYVLDCEQLSLFSWKVCGKERKTSMHANVTVSVMQEW